MCGMGSTAACPQWSQTSDVPKPINVTKKCVKQDNGEWIISLTWQYPEELNSADASLVKVSSGSFGSSLKGCYQIPRNQVQC
jgi:hypothetical protein